MATQERVRKPQTVPTQENKEAQRMLEVARQRQEKEDLKRREAAQAAGKATLEGIDAILDEVDEVLAAEGITTDEQAAEFLANWIQKGGE